MLKLSKLADYGVIILVAMSRQPERLYTAAALAEELHLGKETAAKCLKLMTKASLVESHRGSSGGYTLAKGADKINVVEVIRALEGPVELTDCVDGKKACSLHGCCPVRGRWDKVNATIIEALAKISIAEMAGGEARL